MRSFGARNLRPQNAGFRSGNLSRKPVRGKLATGVKTTAKPWMRHFGKLKHLHEETVRINRLIEEDSERIDLEMFS